jgi:hypothetical protein
LEALIAGTSPAALKAEVEEISTAEPPAAMAGSPYTATKHQAEVGTGYFEEVGPGIDCEDTVPRLRVGPFQPMRVRLIVLVDGLGEYKISGGDGHFHVGRVGHAILDLDLTRLDHAVPSPAPQPTG